MKHFAISCAVFVLVGIQAGCKPVANNTAGTRSANSGVAATPKPLSLVSLGNGEVCLGEEPVPFEALKNAADGENIIYRTSPSADDSQGIIAVTRYCSPAEAKSAKVALGEAQSVASAARARAGDSFAIAPAVVAGAVACAGTYMLTKKLICERLDKLSGMYTGNLGPATAQAFIGSILAGIGFPQTTAQIAAAMAEGAAANSAVAASQAAATGNASAALIHASQAVTMAHAADSASATASAMAASGVKGAMWAKVCLVPAIAVEGAATFIRVFRTDIGRYSWWERAANYCGK
jgi:hypothetical protein